MAVGVKVRVWGITHYFPGRSLKWKDILMM